MISIGPWDFGGFDIVVLIILLISGLTSFARGFMREIVSVIALVVGLVAALFLFGRFQGQANELIQPSWLANGTLALGSFFIAYFLIITLLGGMTKRLQAREVGFLNRLLGLAYGAARGLLIASFFVVIATLMSEEDTRPNWMEEATFFPVLSNIADKMLNAPFAQIRESAEDTIEKGRDLSPDVGNPDVANPNVDSPDADSDAP